MAGYAIKGTTRDVTTCEQCGRTNLRRTVILAPLDTDGTPGDPVHMGTDCAATALRTTQTRVRAAATTADRRLSEARAWATDFIAIYGAAEGNIRATAEIFFTRNPDARDRCRASEWVWPRLADARRILATGDITGTVFAR